MKIPVAFRHAAHNDLKEIQQLFVDTISNVCSRDYNEEQIKAWSSSVENTKRWIEMLDKQFFLLALFKGMIVGFGSLDKGNCVHLLFVHKDFQRQGVAESILARLEDEAWKSGAVEVTSNVSKTARPFFEKHHFKVIAEQRNLRNHVEIINYKMVKHFSSGEGREIKAGLKL